MKLHIDIETYSSVDIKTCGAYKYMESLDFEILMIAFALDSEEIQIIDLASGEKIPKRFLDLYNNPKIEKHAHNATFERKAFDTYGMSRPISEWHCSAIKAAYCGFPLSLENVSKAMDLKEFSKDTSGKELIKFFSIPIKPTKTNSFRNRNFPEHDPEKWEQFKEYCKQDVAAEREIDRRLAIHEMPKFERDLYILDQRINDRGILVDLTLANNAIKIDELYTEEVSNKLKKLTDIENPNSPIQLRKWLGQALQKDVPSLTKEAIDLLIKEVGPGTVSDVLNLRKKLAKTSTKKYLAMVNCACESNRAHGLFQFYGANRTGRWAGRLIQLQNLPRNYMDSLDLARGLIRSGNLEDLDLQYDDVSKVLSECIRTAFIPSDKKLLCVSDFSAIEARVLSWVANEEWRLEVFRGHGKIYESSAAMMFGVPMESIKKGSPLRDRGKIAELALGYQGSLGALKAMGGEKMGLSEEEMSNIVEKWRKANPKIVKFWANVEVAAKKAVKLKERFKVPECEIYFDFEGSAMTIELPSRKKLFYQSPSFGANKFGQESLRYKGIDQTTGTWVSIDTYGGKLTENIVQAISRDLLAQALLNLDAAGFDTVMHVHDECVAEIPNENPEQYLAKMNKLLCERPDWAQTLPLGAEGYITNFYKKD